MGQIIFSSKFNGGVGNLSIALKSNAKSYHVSLDVNHPSCILLDVPTEWIAGSITGNAPNSAIGSVSLNISGNIDQPFNHSFNAGIIDPYTFGFNVI
jgi:hypothetical protein